MEALAAGNVVVHMPLVEHEHQHEERHRHQTDPPPPHDENDDRHQRHQVPLVLLAETDHGRHAWTIAPLRVAPQAVVDTTAADATTEQARITRAAQDQLSQAVKDDAVRLRADQ